MCTVRIAVNRSRGRDGEGRGAAFFDIECWKAQAENVARFLTQGRKVAVTGRLEHREWDVPEGGRRQRVYVVTDEPLGIEFLDASAAASPANTAPGASQ